jgi:hypothetical protein
MEAHLEYILKMPMQCKGNEKMSAIMRMIETATAVLDLYLVTMRTTKRPRETAITVLYVYSPRERDRRRER